MVSAWLVAATGPLSAEKGAKLPVTVIEKSAPGTTARQDRLDLNKTDRQHPAAESEPADQPETDEQMDPLDLLVPSDPHVEETPDVADEKPRPKATKRTRKSAKPSGTRRAISISKRKGKLVLNRFHTLKLNMEHDACRKFPTEFLADYKLPNNAVETLADNMIIIQRRICASNGSIMVTCYHNEATLSMRQARPDDGCSR